MTDIGEIQRAKSAVELSVAHPRANAAGEDERRGGDQELRAKSGVRILGERAGHGVLIEMLFDAHQTDAIGLADHGVPPFGALKAVTDLKTARQT